jgi:hypothetical protein
MKYVIAIDAEGGAKVRDEISMTERLVRQNNT